jgi:hypothetical protein
MKTNIHSSKAFYNTQSPDNKQVLNILFTFTCLSYELFIARERLGFFPVIKYLERSTIHSNVSLHLFSEKRRQLEMQKVSIPAR